MMFSFVTEENGTYRPQSLSAGITSPRQRLLLMPDEPDRRGKVTPSRNQEQARPATTWADRESDSESARSHSRISTSSDATSPRVSTSRPDAITRLSTSEPASGIRLLYHQVVGGMNVIPFSERGWLLRRTVQ